MKIKDDFDTLQAIIDRAANNRISTQQLLREAESLEMPFEFADLIGYWQRGKLYASQVERTPDGYIPGKDCTWTTQYQMGFFGFNPALGTFEINPFTRNPITAILDASIALESAGTCVSIHPSGKEFAVGTLNGAICICGLSQGRVIRTFRANHSRVWTLAYSPAGDILLSGHQNGELVKWTNEGIQLEKVQTNDWVRSIAFSPDGSKFLTSHRVKKDENTPSIYQWDTASFKDFETFIHTNKTIWCIRYLNTGSGFVAAGSEQKVSLWSFEKNDVVWNEKKHTGTVTTLVVHPLDGIVASGAWTGSVKLWDLETGADLRTVEAHSGRVYGLSISPSGRMLATGGKESSICLWQLPECSIISRFMAHTGWLRGLQFIGEDTLVSVGSEGVSKVWRLSHSLPVSTPVQSYTSSQEVLNDFRRALDADDE